MDLTGSVHYQGIIHLKVCKWYIFKCSFKAFSVDGNQHTCNYEQVVLPRPTCLPQNKFLTTSTDQAQVINIPKKPCWMIFNMIPLPMHPAIASHRNKKGPGSRFEMRSEYSAVTKTSLFVAKITFVVAEMIFKMTVMTYSMVEFTSAVTEITFSGTDIRLLVAKITFVAADKLLKWLWSLLQSQDHFLVA